MLQVHSDLYKGVSGRAYHDGKRALRPEAVPMVMRLRAEKFSEFTLPNHTVFEYGAGSGWNLGALDCARRIAFDPSDFLRDRLQALGIEFAESMEKVPDAVADRVICHHVLEHVPSPAAALSEMRRVLKPGGLLVLHVPWERESRFARYKPEEPNHHLYTWNAQTLGNLVALMDYKLLAICVHKYGYDRYAANLAARFRLSYAFFRLIRGAMVLARPLWEVRAVCAK